MANIRTVTVSGRISLDFEYDDADPTTSEEAASTGYHWKLGIDNNLNGVIDGGIIELTELKAEMSFGDGTYYIRVNAAGITMNPVLVVAAHTHVEADITDLDHYDNADFTIDFAAEDLVNLGTRAHASLTGIGVADHHSKYTNAEVLALSINNLVEDTTPQLGGDLDLNGNNIDFPTTPNISDCIDDDTMVAASATKLATSESIKAYVDAQDAAGGNCSIQTGTYTGNAANNRDIAVAFQPKHLQIIEAGSLHIVWFKTDTMAQWRAHYQYSSSSQYPDNIVDLTATGFQVNNGDASDNCNKNAIVYHWTAWG